MPYLHRPNRQVTWSGISLSRVVNQRNGSTYSNSSVKKRASKVQLVPGSTDKSSIAARTGSKPNKRQRKSVTRWEFYLYGRVASPRWEELNFWLKTGSEKQRCLCWAWNFPCSLWPASSPVVSLIKAVIVRVRRLSSRGDLCSDISSAVSPWSHFIVGW